MLTCQRDGVPLQLFDAEQLRTQQLCVPLISQRVAYVRKRHNLFDGYGMYLIYSRTVCDHIKQGQPDLAG
jgi:hypothetical protein